MLALKETDFMVNFISFPFLRRLRILFFARKILRRIFRGIISFVLWDVNISSGTGVVAGIFFFSIVGLYGMFVGGHTQFVIQSISTTIGLTIENIKVSGQVETSEEEVLQLLGINKGISLIEFNVDSARKKVFSLPWIERVEIRKIYPNTLKVSLIERHAYAIWQHGSHLSLIDKSGKIIVPLHDRKFINLPMFVGHGAEKEAPSFAKYFVHWVGIKARVKAYVRVADRRWDLYFHNGIVVKLPEEGVDTALIRLFEMQNRYQVLERDISAIDLRLSDRMAIRLTPDSLSRRRAAVNVRERMFSKGNHGT